MKKIVRAISIRQPWVEQILRGEKTAEYRSRKTHIRERVYVYASLTLDDSPQAWRSLGKDHGELPCGVIVGTVDVIDCRWCSRKRQYAYVLNNPKRLRRSLYPKNHPNPGFWRPQF